MDGDTNGNGTSTTPGGTSAWGGVYLNTGASSTISYAVVRYGGSSGSYAGINNYGGTLYLLNSVVASSTYYGVRNGIGSSAVTTITGSDIFNNIKDIYQTAGTTTVTYSNILNTSSTMATTTWGIHRTGGTITVSSSTISGNNFNASSYGFYNALTSTSTAKNNYWGASFGPSSTYPSNQVSGYVDYKPYSSTSTFY